MKYWICIDSDETQGVPVGLCVESENEPDSNWGSFDWFEINHDEYCKSKNQNYKNILLKNIRQRTGYGILGKH